MHTVHRLNNSVFLEATKKLFNNWPHILNDNIKQLINRFHSFMFLENTIKKLVKYFWKKHIMCNYTDWLVVYVDRRKQTNSELFVWELDYTAHTVCFWFIKKGRRNKQSFLHRSQWFCNWTTLLVVHWLSHLSILSGPADAWSKQTTFQFQNGTASE